MRRWNIEAPAGQGMAVAAQKDVLAAQRSLEWQPSTYSAQTSQIPLD
jgi:hypothetical protein